MIFTHNHPPIGLIKVDCSVTHWNRTDAQGASYEPTENAEVTRINEIELEDGTVFTSEAIDPDIRHELMNEAYKALYYGAHI